MKKSIRKMLVRRVLLLLISLPFISVKTGAQEIKVVPIDKFVSHSLYNFTRYIDWPAGTKSGNFIITIVGSNDVYEETVNLTRNMKVGLQPIQVQFVKSANEISGFQHMIYISEWQGGRINTVLQKISNKSTLIVTHNEGLTKKGSMINFIPVDGLMHFEMCQNNLQKQGLFASKILEKMAFQTN